MPPSIQQIVATPGDDAFPFDTLYALTSDGECYYISVGHNYTWQKVPSLPDQLEREST